MQILGIGTDIVENARIGRMIERHGEFFLNRVFTRTEIEYCQAHRGSCERFAGRWAGKEAILKALGTGWREGIAWVDMEIRNDPSGKPVVYLGGGAKERAIRMQMTDLLLSISHCRTHAVAYALATGK